MSRLAAPTLLPLLRWPSVSSPPPRPRSRSRRRRPGASPSFKRSARPSSPCACTAARRVGSGVVIDPEGYALTNFHVVQPTGPVLQCGLADGELYDAVLVGLDKVGRRGPRQAAAEEGRAKPIPVRPARATATPSGPATGRWRWATRSGWPWTSPRPSPTAWSAASTATSRRRARALLEYTDCIQIETSINPGNSGGPLFNMKGELIGINGRGSFEKRGRVNSGVGYAISINQIKNFLGHLTAGLDTDHATLGAAVETAERGRRPEPHGRRARCSRSRDAVRRGLQEGDQLVAFAGRPLTSTNQYKNILGIFPKEWRLPLVYRREQRDSGRRSSASWATWTAEKPEEPAAGRRPARSRRPRPTAGKPKESPAAKLYKEKKGFANYYFNEQSARPAAGRRSAGTAIHRARRRLDRRRARSTWPTARAT